MAGKYKMPFSKDGHQLDWTGYSEGDGSNIDWRENVPFETTMTLTDYSRGRSSATFNWVDSEGKWYSMFMKDMIDLLKTVTLEKGVVKGTWRGVKRGTNYGIQLVPTEVSA